ncbi:PI-PLC X domain-containing protein [Camellia lanceoleosa]|uniref:PI-PLC X domain-containing protein n=1 Tax=Camellia lanceoleosa TaxID=1840588 RepID=A0ACC0J551_9ERIC|nr:PI-PLC X domain-containing protein [Camellia lanceoleosa]
MTIGVVVTRPFDDGLMRAANFSVRRTFSAQGAKVTIIITPAYAQLFQKTIERDQSLGHDINFHIFKLPTSDFGLPDGCETLLAASAGIIAKLFMAFEKLHEPIEQLLRERRPDCIVSDMFHPWTADLGARLGIPRFLFYVTGLFSLCCEESIRRYAPHDKVNSDAETFALPGLPDDNIVFTKSKIPYWFKEKGTGYGQLLDEQPAINTLREVEAFLIENPTEILTIIIEDYVQTPKRLINLFTYAGLDKYLFPESKMPQKGEDWPTVTAMVQENHRLLVFTSIASKEAEEGVAYQWR